MTQVRKDITEEEQRAYAMALEQLKVNSVAFNNELNAQQTLAPKLRELACNHLRTSNTPAAKMFRNECLAAIDQPYEDYLKKQSKDGEWGTDIEAKALGEALKFNIVVTSKIAGRKDATFTLHLESKDAPTIHLYNEGNMHWTNGSSTLGDGNCLYNAVAKELARQSIPEKTASFKQTSNLVTKEVEQKLVATQKSIEAAIQKSIDNHESPAELEEQYKQEQERIESLEDYEKIQIQNDHIFALRIAMGMNAEEAGKGLVYSEAEATRLSM